MKIPTRLRAENENQKHVRLRWTTVFGNTVLETFLTQKEQDRLFKAGIDIEQL